MVLFTMHLNIEKQYFFKNTYKTYYNKVIYIKYFSIDLVKIIKFFKIKSNG